MHDFLLELQSIYAQIAETQFGRLEPGMSEAQVVESYKKTSDTLSCLHFRIGKIMRYHLVPLLESIEDISEDDEQDLFETAQKISAYVSRADPGLALKIYQGLLERSKKNQDIAGKIKYLYWCGITQHFLSREEHGKILDYFEEGASYVGQYHQFEDPETRSYIHRCLGNTSMVYYMMNNTQKALEVDESAFSFWNGLMFSGKDLDFPWLSYFLTCLTHRHINLSETVHNDPDSETKEGLRRLLETSVTIYKLYQRNRESFSVFGGTRFEFMLWEAQFLNGLISFDLLLENVEKKKAEFHPDDFSPDAMYVKHDLDAYLIFYAINKQSLRNKREEIIALVSANAIDYFSKIPKSVNPMEVASQLINSAKNISSAFEPDEQLDFVLNMTTFRHIPTYAHSIMVARIATCLTKYLTKKNPQSFVGSFGITNEDQVNDKAEELCRFAHTSGLCHDVGKISYAANPYIHARALTEGDFDLIKRHTIDGKTMLSRYDGILQNEGHIDVAWGHHKYYDNSGGYPDDFDISGSKYRIMVDIISVADSIVAATDDVVKSYAKPKSLEEICAEIQNESGTRYSPAIAEALKDDELQKALADIIANERGTAYHTAYQHAWS